MSTILSETNGVKARKKYKCCLCGEIINPGEQYDKRTGVESGDIWTMRMHPECHAHENKPAISRRLSDNEWYEDISEPAFSRAEALGIATDEI